MPPNDDIPAQSAGFAQDQCPYEADVDPRARPIVRVLAWACLATVAILSLVPGELRPHSFLPGQAEHFIAYAVAGLLLALAYWSTRQRILGWLCGSIASGGFEILQNFVPRRSPSIWDALASVAGLTFGILLGAALSRKHRRGRDGNMD
jgi:VanZ family protein